MTTSPSPPKHKPRRRGKDISSVTSLNTHQSETLPSNTTPTFPLASFLWPARGGLSKWALFPILFLVAGLFRWAISLWPYSGLATPPMHGDFEAQRHWMEITLHLPVSHWYFHDLEWWGLDYPPLTAYHSWLLGSLGSMIDPRWFALHRSRGLDDKHLKTYMRTTVLISEYLIFVPALVYFVRRFSSTHRTTSWEASVAVMAILMQPGIILIDHGHFQYNTVMLGLVVACLACIMAHRRLWACVFFVAALGFKQMTLYYAPPIFAFLLGSCIQPRMDISRLLAISMVTVGAFVALFAPLLLGSLFDRIRSIEYHYLEKPAWVARLGFAETSYLECVAAQLGQAIHRMFPFTRGLFEDKVANFWCAAHTFYKLKHFSTKLLQRLSLGATILSILPSCVAIFINPNRTLLPLAFASSAWGFFLFSFQVHEKSVLLALLPMTLLLAGEGGMSAETRAWISWANLLGSWTMFPLLQRDQLRVPYFVLSLLWGWLMGEPSALTDWGRPSADQPGRYSSLLHSTFYAIMVAWHVGEALIPPPDGKPDLWVVLNVLIGAAGFGVCYLWCVAKLIYACSLQRLRQASDWKAKSL